MRVTLDTNGLFNIKLAAGGAKNLHRLLELHSAKVMTICIPAIAASENRRSGEVMDNYAEFKTFVTSLGIDNYEELLPMAYVGVSYLDHCLVASEEMVELERRIHGILFPQVEFEYRAYMARRGRPVTELLDRRWRNVKCDVQAMWSHIYHGADVFVTEDRNFHKTTKKLRLIQLGARRICTPSECAALAGDLSGV